VDQEKVDIRLETEKHLYDFAKEGLRTLLICEKIIPEQHYLKWSEKYAAAENEVGNIRTLKVDKMSNLIEDGLEVLGATAVQDNLQDGVVETLRDLKEANINVWVLTGDKEETAVNIGFACGIIDNRTGRHFITASKKNDILN